MLLGWRKKKGIYTRQRGTSGSMREETASSVLRSRVRQREREKKEGMEVREGLVGQEES